MTILSTSYKFGTSENLQVREPIGIKTPPKELQQVCGTRSLGQPFVTQFKNASLIGPTALGVTSSSNIILETCISRRDILERDLVKHPSTILRMYAHQKRSRADGTTDFDTVCSLVNLYDGYYHWIQNSLTRLEGVERYANRTGTQPTLVIRNDPPSWVVESLNLLGYTEDQWIEWDRNYATVDQLIVPSMRRRESLQTYREHQRSDDLTYKDASANAYSWLRDQAIRNLDCDRSFSSKVLISREDAHGRRIQNKDAVLQLLEPLGFQELVLSELSFQEQVKSFSGAEIIISPHGAGLINTIFAPDNCKVIELFPEWVKPTFFILSNTLGHQYGYIECDQTRRDLIVDIDELNRMLENMDII